jgi:hypothetical protein
VDVFASAAPLRRAAVLAAVGVALLAVGALAAPAQANSEHSTPGSADLAALATDLAQARAVRVTGTFGTRVVRDVRLDATGIAAAGWGPGGRVRPAVIASSEVMPPERPEPIAWSEISRIETGRTSTRRLGGAGLVMGGLLGFIVWKTIPLGYDGAQGSAPAVIGVPALAGLALGALLGAQEYQWRPVYTRGHPGRV